MDLQSLKAVPPWEWPRTTGASLKEFIRNSGHGVSDRVTAIQLAGDMVVMDDEMAEALLSILRDPKEPPEVRGPAAISLGPVLEQTESEEFDDIYSDPAISAEMFEKIKGTLHRVYMDESAPKLVRRRILEASVRASAKWHAKAVREAAAEDDEDWKLTAAFCMRYVPGFDQQILKMLESPNPAIHREAVIAAGAHEVSWAWPHVRRLLDAKGIDKELLLAAIEAAGSIRPKEARRVLEPFLDDDDEEIAEAADEAVMMAEAMSEDDEDEEDEDVS